MRLLFLAPFLLLLGCKCPPPPVCPGADMSRAADLSAPVDLSATPDQACLRCDAVLNPCPALGLFCNPASGCCDSAAH